MTEAPSVVRVKGLDTDVEATPDTASVVVKPMVTFALFQPAALAMGAGMPKVKVGGVISILMPATEAAALTFPALSVQVPEAD